MKLLLLSCGKRDQKREVVLYVSFAVSCAVTADFAALFTAVNDQIALARVRLCADRTHQSHAGIGAVTGIAVNVQGIKAVGAVIP